MAVRDLEKLTLELARLLALLRTETRPVARAEIFRDASAALEQIQAGVGR